MTNEEAFEVVNFVFFLGPFFGVIDDTRKEMLSLDGKRWGLELYYFC